MPRKIDDVRRMALLKACVLLVVAATVVWAGYDAWMRPYRARRRRLEEEVREGKSFLEDIALGRAGNLAVTRDRLAAIASSSDGRGPVPDAGTGTGEYAAAITGYMEARKAVQAAARKAAALAGSIDGMLEGGPGGKKTRAEARAQDLADALAAMEAVRDARLPSAAAAEAAENLFNGAYGKAMEAANRIPEWKRLRTDAEAVAKEMAEAKRRLKEASGRIRTIRQAWAGPASGGSVTPSESVLETLRKVDGELERAAAAYLAVRQEAHEKVEEAYAKCRRASAALREARRAANRWPREAKETLRGGIAAWSELQPQLRKHKAALEKRGEHGTEMLRQADAIRSEVREMLRESGSTRGIDATRVARLQAEGASVRYGLDRAAAALGGEAFQRLLDEFAGRADSILETVRKAKEGMPKRAFRTWKKIVPGTAGLAGRACVRTSAGEGDSAMEDDKWQRA